MNLKAWPRRADYNLWSRFLTVDAHIEARDLQHLLAGSKSFHKREEVETLRAGLAAIEWPDDELSVFATLKGSLFAIRDEVLLRFRHEFGALHPFQAERESSERSHQPSRGRAGSRGEPADRIGSLTRKFRLLALMRRRDRDRRRT